VTVTAAAPDVTVVSAAEAVSLAWCRENAAPAAADMTPVSPTPPANA
jgi:hypothetical protein